MNYNDVVAAVLRDTLAYAERAITAGVDKRRLVIDPAHDFGKGTFHSLEITRRLGELVATGYPVLVSLSNKDFVGETLDLTVNEVSSALLLRRRSARWPEPGSIAYMRWSKPDRWSTWCGPSPGGGPLHVRFEVSRERYDEDRGRPGSARVAAEVRRSDRPVADLRAACLTAVPWLLDHSRERVVLLCARQPYSVNVGRHLLGVSRFSGEIEVSLLPGPAPDLGGAAVLAVADGSACRSEKAPGYLDERAFDFDAGIGAALTKGDH